MLFASSPDAAALRKALAAAGPAWEKDLVSAHREVAKKAANLARAAARGGTKRQAAAAKAIGQSASKAGAKLTVGAPSGAPYGRAEFWGARRRFGWYAAEKYDGSRGQQSPNWVGNTWRAGVKGEGPYVLNDTLADHIEDIKAVYAAQLDAVAKALANRRITTF